MKKVSKILAVILSLALCMFALAGCSSYNKVLKAFEKEGYTEVKASEASGASSLKFGEDVSAEVHALKSGDTIAHYVIIIEFGSSEELNKQIEENEGLKGMLKDAQKSDFVNGNCVCVPIAILPDTVKKVYEIFKNA